MQWMIRDGKHVGLEYLPRKCTEECVEQDVLECELVGLGGIFCCELVHVRGWKKTRKEAYT